MNTSIDDLIAEWKLQHGHVYISAFKGQDFYYRAITLGEFKSITVTDPDLKTAKTEDLIVRLALLYPKDFDFDNAPAGVLSGLAEQIFNMSGFGDPGYASQLMDEERKDVQQFSNIMKTIILTALPAYKEEELDLLSFHQLAHKTALAEEILKLKQSVDEGSVVSLAIIDPEKEEEMKRQQKAKTTKPGSVSYDDPIASRLRRAGA